MTPAERALRILEISEHIAPLVQEMAEHEAWIKQNVPAGEYLGEGFKVKRWDQNSTLNEDLVIENFPIAEHPECYRSMAITEKMRDYLPREEYPDCYTDAVDPSAMKELLSEDEKATYFKQVPYLKVTAQK